MIDVRALQSTSDAEWVARVMANSQPWITLSISYERSLALLTNASRERYLAEVSGQRAGFLMVSM
jgi:hypothetical protein